MRRTCTIVFVGIFLCFVLFNYIAWNHASAMMQFVINGTKTSRPENLRSIEMLKVLLTSITVPRPENQKTPQLYNLPFTTHTFPNQNGEQLEAWLISHPTSSKLIVLFHGYSSSKESLIPLAEAFYQMGYSTFLVDFFGSGGSTGDKTTIGLQEAQDVVASIQFLQTKWPKKTLVLYGVSMGGSAILRAIAKHHVQPDGIILESTFDSLLTTISHRFELMGIPAFPSAQIMMFWGGIQNHVNAFEHNPLEYAKSVKCPAFVLHGSLDTRVSRQEALNVYNSISTKKYFRSYRGVEHQLIIEKQSNKWKRDMIKFLKTI